ncbi:MAG: hypothetical protein ACQESR_13385 [Planctomycetota bacterium]
MQKPLARLLGTAILISSTVGAVLIAQSLAPEEKAPSRVQLPDGSVRFIFQSLRESASWPAGAAAFVASGLALPYLLRLVTHENPEEKRPPHIVWRLVGYILIAFLALLFAKALLLDPLLNFRSLVLTSDEVTLNSLYSTWSIPFSDISNTHLERNDTSRRGRECTDLRYEIRGVAGNMHRSILVTCSRPSNELSEYVAFFDAMDAEVKRRLKKKRANKAMNADK